MFSIGRLCVKLAGRDSGKKCVIVEILEKNYVLIDGETRRKRVNINHLEPLDQKLDIKDKASRADVKVAFDKLGIKLLDTKPKKPGEKPKKQRKVKQKQIVEEKAKPKVEKKVEVSEKKSNPESKN